MEVETADLTPAAQHDWDYSLALRAASADQLREAARLAPIEDLCPLKSITSVTWSDGGARLYFSDNFFRTVEGGIATATATNDHAAMAAATLRPVEWVLWFATSDRLPTPDVMVVTGREASGILRAAQLRDDARLEEEEEEDDDDDDEGSGQGAASNALPSPPSQIARPLWLVSLSSLKTAFDLGWRGESPWPEQLAGGATLLLPQTISGPPGSPGRASGGKGVRWCQSETFVANVLARLHLINGGTQFGPARELTSDLRFAALRDAVLTNKDARSAAHWYSDVTGKSMLYAKSHLEAVCQSLNSLQSKSNRPRKKWVALAHKRQMKARRSSKLK